MNVIIRDAELRDVQDRGYVHYKAWQETYTGLINQEYLEKRYRKIAYGRRNKKAV